jgi:glycosyltransferase involved in cell wall biosynthesis
VRVALLHSFYESGSSSGENVVVNAQAHALLAAGHQVLLLGRHTDHERRRSAYPLRAAWRTVTHHGPNPADRLADFEPDVVHIHNTVPNIGLQWLPAWTGPIVHTLHNFRPLCANGLLYRDGHLCTDCPDGRPWSAVEHACYRESRVATTPVAVRNSLGMGNNPLLSRADVLVVLSEYARDVYLRYGVDSDQLRLVPNGVPDVPGELVPDPPEEQRWLAVGRLREEKGFGTLVASWPREVALDIIGDGPQRDELADLATGRRVRLLGQLPREQVRDAMGGYTGLVFTSLAPESAMPLVVIEALASGVPVMIVDSSPHAAGLIADGVAMGVHLADGRLLGDDVAAAMAWAIAGGRELRARCREVFLERYTEQRWVAALEQTYADAADRRAAANEQEGT